VQVSGGSPADQVIFPSSHDGPSADVHRSTSGHSRRWPATLINLYILKQTSVQHRVANILSAGLNTALV
jgi:hypothetical protein